MGSQQIPPAEADGDARARPRARTSPRSLAPREHGAYGQLGLPLCAALAMGRPGLGACALALASVAAFLGHEPALIALGHRGPRALREDGGRARRRLLLLGAAAALLGGLGLALVPPAARSALAIPGALAAALGALIARGVEKAALGEIVAAAALSSASLPVALGSGVSASAAWGAWAAWSAAFIASTFAVRTVIAHARSPIAWPRRLAAPVAVSGLLALAAGAGGLPRFAALAAAPMLLIAIVIAAAPPSPRALKRVGWALVGASALLGVLLAVGARVSEAG
ncbi:hypothetical protein SOCEGT47_014570 [Sorangium cellulosum]|uniref:Uncharacterized protein n=1 Tax=Sorangium cellulosum TaxID=56 RepID=A0A4P2PW64_SORCE|nr:YwiC-like family protein [Sorangium cellulosum]AUX20979.1 hypothetical protein SOCEGT47_014570 [Sorangium cellulosum]